MGTNAPSRRGMPVPQRFITLAGGCLALLAAFKVYQEAGDLMQSGVDIADGNVMVSLVADRCCPWCSRRSADAVSPCRALPFSVRRACALAWSQRHACCVVGVATAALVCVALFAVEGGGVMLLGAVESADGSLHGGHGRGGRPLTFRSLPLLC